MAKITLCKWCVNKSLMGFVPKGCSSPSTDGVGATLNFFAIFLPVFPQNPFYKFDKESGVSG
jgi:hypothetical protein